MFSLASTFQMQNTGTKTEQLRQNLEYRNAYTSQLLAL
jgi:hypothetical protein